MTKFAFVAGLAVLASVEAGHSVANTECAPGTHMTSLEECVLAIDALGASIAAPVVVNDPKAPQGCIVKPWAGQWSPGAFYNTAAGSKSWSFGPLCRTGAAPVSPTPKPPTPEPTPAAQTPAPQTPAAQTPAAPATPLVPVTPIPNNGNVADVVKALKDSNPAGVFEYETATGGWKESDLYTWPDMIKAVSIMGNVGVGEAKLWMGPGTKYGLVNIAAFLAQCMQETIRYNACDENNWSDDAVVKEHGGSSYSATSACGQLHQSYQDYSCTAEEDTLAKLDGGKAMACEMDPTMVIRATTAASWYGAPPKLFCAPKELVPKSPRWNYKSPWCPLKGGYDYQEDFKEHLDQDELKEYFAYVKDGGNCRDYPEIKTGGWSTTGQGCSNGACGGADAPLFGQPTGRTDVEGCCWWGRGVIQTTGTCNFGKLNYFMGKRAFDRTGTALFPTIDFCQTPDKICEPDSATPELKWIAGFFYWLNAVQPYNAEAGAWNYQQELVKWVDAGLNVADLEFINGASGIVNRGCHNPPNCGTGELHAGKERNDNFIKVLKAMGLN